MPDILFQFDSPADRNALLEALTTRDRITGWWTDRAEVPSTVGEDLVLTFEMAPAPFRLRLDADGPERVTWSYNGFPPPWEGTAMEWTLSDNPGGPGTRVHFRHGGWQSDGDPLPSVAFTWGLLMPALKHYVESGERSPLMVAGGGHP